MNDEDNKPWHGIERSTISGITIRSKIKENTLQQTATQYAHHCEYVFHFKFIGRKNQQF